MMSFFFSTSESLSPQSSVTPWQFMIHSRLWWNNGHCNWLNWRIDFYLMFTFSVRWLLRWYMKSRWNGLSPIRKCRCVSLVCQLEASFPTRLQLPCLVTRDKRSKSNPPFQRSTFRPSKFHSVFWGKFWWENYEAVATVHESCVQPPGAVGHKNVNRCVNLVVAITVKEFCVYLLAFF